AAELSVFAWAQALADKCGALLQHERVTTDCVRKMRTRRSAFKVLSRSKLKQNITTRKMRRAPVDTVVFLPYDGRKALAVSGMEAPAYRRRPRSHLHLAAPAKRRRHAAGKANGYSLALRPAPQDPIPCRRPGRSASAGAYSGQTQRLGDKPVFLPARHSNATTDGRSDALRPMPLVASPHPAWLDPSRPRPPSRNANKSPSRVRCAVATGHQTTAWPWRGASYASAVSAALACAFWPPR